jgi:hypothetical protein
LGLKRLEDCNHTAMMRHIWNIFARVGSLWVAWVREYLLKGKSFGKSRYRRCVLKSWKKLLNLRDLAQGFIQFKVGDSSIFIWLDWWHPIRVSYDKYEYRAVYDTGSTMVAKLSSVIREKN